MLTRSLISSATRQHETDTDTKQLELRLIPRQKRNLFNKGGHVFTTWVIQEPVLDLEILSQSSQLATVKPVKQLSVNKIRYI